MSTPARVVLWMALSVPAATAQPNEIPGTDIEMGILGIVNDIAAEGTHPNGQVGFAMATTSCNVGAVQVPWKAPMQADHPFIAFLLVRESGDRMVQISDRSYVKHGFFALNNSQCTPCQNPGDSAILGVGCSDTYSVGTNANNAFLGPPDEIDPWTGEWDPICSFFDQGQPPLAPPLDCDGIKSPIVPVDSIGGRIRVAESELLVPGSTFYYQGQYVVRGELEENRGNNLASREFKLTWNGFNWITSVDSPSTNPQLFGSVLSRWSGATVTSAVDVDDGRVYAAVKTIPLGGGITRYEYALHNRDHAAGIDAFRVPVCPAATITNVGFRDLDEDPLNDWTSSRTTTELVFSAGENRLRWNSIYNVWFDSDAAPVDGRVARLGDSMTLTTTAPLGPVAGQEMGFGDPGAFGVPPRLDACGSFDAGGTGSLLLRLAPPGSVVVFLASLSANPTPVIGGTLVPMPIQYGVVVVADAHGDVAVSGAGGGGPATLYVQYAVEDAAAPYGVAWSNALALPFGP